jgi:hypothetical protein
MKLTGLVTALGSQPIGSSDRAATLTVYNGSEQVTTLSVAAPEPQIGDQYDVSIEKRS